MANIPCPWTQKGPSFLDLIYKNETWDDDILVFVSFLEHKIYDLDLSSILTVISVYWYQ